MGELLYYDEEEEWNRALLLYDAVLKEISTKLEILNNEFKLAHQYNPIEHITSRIKSAQSIARKISIKGKELTVENIIKYVNDVAGVRIICSFTSDIYRIAEAIAKQDDVTVLQIKDYIREPKELSHDRIDSYFPVSGCHRYKGGNSDPHNRDGFLGKFRA